MRIDWAAVTIMVLLVASIAVMFLLSSIPAAQYLVLVAVLIAVLRGQSG